VALSSITVGSTLVGSCTSPMVGDDAGAGEDVAAIDAATLDARGEDAPRVCTASATPSRLVVTADWLSRSLTLLGLERVLDPGCDAEDAIVATISLDAYPPGPLEVEITPDGRTAIVSVGPGFFEGAGAALVGMPSVPEGAALLLVDLDTRAVLAEIETAHTPMGIAVSPDGTRAYVAEYGTNASPGTEIAVVDLTTRTLVEEISIGPRPEQVVVSADGTLGAATVDDGTRVFETRDVGGTLAPTLDTGRDPSGVVFVPGTDRLVITNSMAASFSIVDVSDPGAPSIVASPTIRGVPYPATWIPGTTDVLVGASIRESLYRLDVTTPDATPSRIELSHGPFVLEAEVVPAGTHALVAHPIQRTLVAVDLATGAEHALSWLDAAGPTYVAIQPSL
jgi:DNA-binding beta-propeller fold protein YncE